MLRHPIMRRPSLPQRILRFLASRSSQSASCTIIARRLGLPRKQVSNACHRMMLDGRLRWVELGVYAVQKESD